MKKGLVIAFPTDTVYGLATPYDDNVGLERINEIKKRSLKQRVAVLCDSINMIESLAYVSNDAKLLIQNFMPGAFTIILKSKKSYIEKTNEDTIGVRIPKHDMALKIIGKYGPLKTTSLNLHNEPPINSYSLILDKFSEVIDIIYEGIIVDEAMPSTVIDFTNIEYKIVRSGIVTKEMIDNVLIK